MQSPERPLDLPLEYAAELVFEIGSLRSDCSEAAQHLVEQRPLDESALDECARFDDALARAHVILARAVARARNFKLGRERGSR
jgi:hypothetical protein